MHELQRQISATPGNAMYHLKTRINVFYYITQHEQPLLTHGNAICHPLPRTTDPVRTYTGPEATPVTPVTPGNAIYHPETRINVFCGHTHTHKQPLVTH